MTVSVYFLRTAIMRMTKSMIFILALFVTFLVTVPCVASGQQNKGDQRAETPSRRHSQALLDTYYESYQTRVERHVYKNTTQGELAIYVHFPEQWRAENKRPAIVFFFGGGWTGGRVEQFARQANYLASRGMVTARADYRVRSRHQTTPDKCVEDGKSAIRWLRKNAAKFGIDPDRIVASGGSAGGHIAACTYTVTGLDAEGEDTNISAQPNLLVLYNPVLKCVDERIAQRMGSADMADRLSPNLNLDRNGPPAIVFYGSNDRFYPQGKQFLQSSSDLGNTVELYVAEGQPHGFFNRSPWHQQTTFLVDQFLAQNGYLTGEPTLKLGSRKAGSVPEGGITLRKIAPEQDKGQKPRKQAAEEPALKVGQLAPDFKLPPLDIQAGSDGESIGKIGSKLISLSSFQGKKPVCLIFSSYT